MAIEDLVARGGGEMGDGGGQFVISRDQHDPDGPLVRRRITRTYQRTAYHLQVLTLRDEAGIEQTIRVTDEHPFYVAGKGWTPARALQAGESLLGSESTITVIDNVGEAHPHGVTVFNLEVEKAHTYFAHGEDAAGAAPVWVHNATAYAGTGPRIDNRFGHNRRIREFARDVTARGETVLAGGRGFDGMIRKEKLFDTIGGFKSARRPDLLVRRTDGSIYGVNVGRTEASGRPVLRERLAIQDLNEQAGLEMVFVPYGARR
jgi:hypothetical protein